MLLISSKNSDVAIFLLLPPVFKTNFG